MPKKSKKGSLRSLGDITINDFANSSVPKNRPKKSSNNTQIVLKSEVEKNWDDKDEEDFDGEFIPITDKDGTITYVIRKAEPRVRKKTLSSSDKQDKSGNGKIYPIDIWFLLSEYIRPEDVGTFAAICTTSFEVVCSARFWFSLYRRYYKNVPTMPECLQPERLIRRYGLRTNVIRALFHMYQPFVNRIKPVTTFEQHPECLKSYECHLVWHTRKSSNFIYFFKMKRKSLSSVLSHSRTRSEMPDLLEILDDISANPDEHCRVLEVSCLHFCPVPPTLGLALKSVSLTLSSAPKFQYHRLQLVFDTAARSLSNLPGGADSVTVVLDPVINIKVLDWWHPLYPGSRNMNELRRNQD